MDDSESLRDPGPGDLSDEENWTGGYYGLLLCLGESSDCDSDLRLAEALRALWDAPGLDDCSAERPTTPEQEGGPGWTASQPGRRVGRAQLPSGAVVVCASFALRSLPFGPIATDWLDLGIPMGALARVEDRVSPYPFGQDTAPSLAWRQPLDEWFTSLIQRVSETSSIVVGGVGYELQADELVDVDHGRLVVRRHDGERNLAVVVPGENGFVASPATF